MFIIVSVVYHLSLIYQCIIFGTVKLEQLYSRAQRKHGQLNRDVVHDLYVKFGQDLPSDAYITVCINNRKIEPIQQRIEVQEEDNLIPEQDQMIIMNRAIENLRSKYELEIDTFLECCVNSDYKSFSIYSGISVSVLKKICTFAKKIIQHEYRRLV